MDFEIAQQAIINCKQLIEEIEKMPANEL